MDGAKKELIRSVLVIGKALDKEEVASLLDCNLDVEGDDSLITGLMAMCKKIGVNHYIKLKAFKQGAVNTIVNGNDGIFGVRQAFGELHAVLQTELPPPPPQLPTALTLHHLSHRMLEITPSTQVDNTKPEAKEEFFKNVEDVTTVVEDAYLMWAYVTSKGTTTTGLPQGYPGTTKLDEGMAKALAAVSGPRRHSTVDQEQGTSEPARKFAKLGAQILNSNGTICEDGRSGNFADFWDNNIKQEHSVGARPQFIAHKLKASIKRTDVNTFTKVAQNAIQEIYSGTVDAPALIKWKNAYAEGADREGAHYALLIQCAFPRKRFLVFMVSDGDVLVHGLYTRYGTDKARRVLLGRFNSLEDCLTMWLRPLVWFVNHSECESPTPQFPTFSLFGANSEKLSKNTFKVTHGDKTFVYKMYDYTNRTGIAKGERRWMNWDLVVDNYPQGVEKVVDIPDLQVFRYPFQEVEGDHPLGPHIPKNMEMFRKIGTKLQKLHSQGWVWGDVRLANMLFVGDEAYVIDLDFARRFQSHPVYINGYRTEDLPRHINAKEGQKMELEHDVYSYWRCFQVLCGYTEEKELPARTMEDLMKFILDDEYKEVPTAEQILESTKEFGFNTGSPDRPTKFTMVM